LLIFSKADKGSFKNIEKILQSLEYNTGLYVNKDKSRIFLGKACQNEEELKDLITIPVGALPTRYLGIPLSINYLKAKDFSSLIDICKARMDGWTSKKLSFAGRI